MASKQTRRLRHANSLESSTRLLWGFIGALLVTMIGKIFEDSLDKRLWLFALLGVLVVTSYGQNLFAAAYNGAVSGLFFNFFFVSQDESLTFHSANDWWLEVTFIAVGVAASLLGRWMPRKSDGSKRAPEEDPNRDSQDFLWRSRSSDGRSSKNKEKAWTS